MIPLQLNGNAGLAAPSRFGDRRRIRVGLLGGSFNPVHAGHLAIAEVALARLRLDQIWLLVSPGNPLKQAGSMAPLAVRLAAARAAATNPRILATDIERHFRNAYTLNTLRTLRRLFPRVEFVWLMGSDNLAQLPFWKGWKQIVHTVPFAVLPRPTYNQKAIAGLAAKRFRDARRGARQAVTLAAQQAPAWLFLEVRQTAVSATALRAAAAGEDPSQESPLHRRPLGHKPPVPPMPNASCLSRI